MFAAGFGLSGVGIPKALGDWDTSGAASITSPQTRSTKDHRKPILERAFAALMAASTVGS
jgi:hypothetical protein